MSAEYVQILYVGDALAAHSLQACVEPLDWLVYAPKTENEALGMYIGYMPHITILDGKRSIVKNVLHHLRTVNATPIVILGSAHDYPETDDIHVVPPFTALTQLVQLVTDLVERYPRRF